MTTYNWKNGDSGNWGTAGDWQQGAVPNSTTADVTIASATNIGVTLAAGQTFTADSVTLDSSGVNLRVAGLLNLGGATDELFVNAGTLNVTAGGTIANGTIDAGNGVVNLSEYATLDHITYVGNFALTANFDSIYVEGGFRVVNPNGGAASLTVGGKDTNIYFASNQTFDDIGINLTGYNGLIGSVGSGNRGYTAAFTFGSTTTINATGSGYGNFISGTSVVNAGMINVSGDSGLGINTTTGFTNSGTINIAAGSNFGVSGGALDNTGLINVAAGSRLGLGSDSNSPSNYGSIIAGGTLVMVSSFTLPELSQVIWGNASQLDVLSGLNLEGGTLAVGGDDNIVVYGNAAISNGTIDTTRGTLSLQSRVTLDNITVKGPLNLTGVRYELLSYDGLKVQNASGGPGVINITGYSAELYCNSETIDDVGINLGVAGKQSDDGINANGLTLGSHATVNSNGTGVFNIIYEARGLGIVNAGTINVAGKGLAFDTDTFTNSGIINISAGSQAVVFSRVVNGSYVKSTFTNSGLIEGTGIGTSTFATVPYPNATPDIKFETVVHGTLTAGGFEANAGNTLALDLSGQVINTDDGVIILNGAGSNIREYKGASGAYVSLESTLRTIGSGGTLELLGGLNINSSHTLNVEGGTLELGGGTFNAGLELTTPQSRLTGFGTVQKAVNNDGVIEASGGTLVIDGAVSGAGALQIGAASTLELTTGTSEAVSFAGAASGLILEAPALFTGTLGGIAAGDSIDLAGETASSARISGSSLLVTLTNHTVLDYTLASALPMEGVSISNGSSGAELTFYQLPAAAAAPKMLFMGPSAVPDKAVPARPPSLPPLQDLWSGATQYRPFLTSLFGRAALTNPQHLQSELGNMPTPANAGIVLAGLQNGELSHILNHDLPFAPPMGIVNGHI
jgi:hypothetical protein